MAIAFGELIVHAAHLVVVFPNSRAIHGAFCLNEASEGFSQRNVLSLIFVSISRARIIPEELRTRPSVETALPSNGEP